MYQNHLSDYLILYSCCLITKGWQRDTIIDIQRNRMYCIPNTLTAILETSCNTALRDIINKITSEDLEIFDEYIKFILDNELGFFVRQSEINFYPKLELEWDFPSNITNMIFEIKPDYDYIDTNFILQVENSGCIAIALLFYDFFSIGEIEKYILKFRNTAIQSVSIYVNYNKTFKTKDIATLINNNLRISIMYIYSTYLKFNKYKTISNIYSSNKKLERFICGNVGKEYFVINQLFYTESQHYNTCLNRKISIDAAGNIKNCPSMPQTYGNIADTTLAEAIEKQGFKDLWHIKKDDIEVCKDCEFRHICTDCRAFIKDPNNIYSHPEKCGYNPYICKWQCEEGYVPVEGCGTYSKETGFVPDAEKIEKLNKKIWGE